MFFWFFFCYIWTGNTTKCSASTRSIRNCRQRSRNWSATWAWPAIFCSIYPPGTGAPSTCACTMWWPDPLTVCCPPSPPRPWLTIWCDWRSPLFSCWPPCPDQRILPYMDKKQKKKWWWWAGTTRTMMFMWAWHTAGIYNSIFRVEIFGRFLGSAMMGEIVCEISVRLDSTF